MNNLQTLRSFIPTDPVVAFRGTGTGHTLRFRSSRAAGHAVLVLFGFILYGPWVMAQTENPPAPLTGDPEAGRIYYRQFGCHACHGYTGETGSGTRLNPPRLQQQTFIAYVRRPSGRMVGTGPSAAMPAYTGPKVTDQVLTDIYAWLESIPSTSPPLADIPLLQR